MAKTMGVRQAALEFGLPASLIYNAVSKGQLPGVSRLGKRIILNRSRFEEFFDGIALGKGDQAEPTKPRLVDPFKVAETRIGGTGKPAVLDDFIIGIIESFASEGLSSRDIARRLGGKKTGVQVLHDGRTFRMPSQWTINKYARIYKEGLLTRTVLSGGIHDERGVRKVQDKPVKENTATVQTETNDINRHRITIGNTFDCVNCGERFKKDHRLILTAMQGLKPKDDREKSYGVNTGDPRLISYALCGASCLIEFTTKKEQEQWILTPLRSKEDLEEEPTKEAGLWRRFRNLAGGNG